MPIPKDILAVERPSSTRVKKSGNRYLVIKRTSKRVGNRVVPVELGTIGEIIDGRYVELRSAPRRKRNVVDIKDYGEVALCNSAAKDLFLELNDVFDTKTAEKLFVIALLRAADSDIKDRDLKFAYDTSFLSELYPSVGLSENTVSDFLEDVGMAYRYIQKFMENRVARHCGKTLVIDGTLKDSNSIVNSFSEFSRKGCTKGSRDMNLLYAYDVQTQEPVAAKPYPGNMLDMTAIEDFVRGYSIKTGILVMDKGFYSKAVIERLKTIEGLTYIIPLKNTAKVLRENNILDGIVSPLTSSNDSVVFYKKVKISDKSYIYAFRDPRIAGEQEAGYYVYAKKKKIFSEEKLLEKRNGFGVIAFESKSDLSPSEVYEAYAKRWEIETMFYMYKEIIELDTVNVHSDYSVYATELINYLSVIISLRVKKKLKNTPLSATKKNKSTAKNISEVYSYRQVMRYLSKYKMLRVGDSENWIPCQMVKYISELAMDLGV